MSQQWKWGDCQTLFALPVSVKLCSETLTALWGVNGMTRLRYLAHVASLSTAKEDNSVFKSSQMQSPPLAVLVQKPCLLEPLCHGMTLSVSPWSRHRILSRYLSLHGHSKQSHQHLGLQFWLQLLSHVIGHVELSLHCQWDPARFLQDVLHKDWASCWVCHCACHWDWKACLGFFFNTHSKLTAVSKHHLVSIQEPLPSYVCGIPS